MKRNILLISTLLLASTSVQAADVVNERLESYRAEGAQNFDAERGRAMWNEQRRQAKSGTQVSCASCHTADLRATGKHIKTGKLIEAMSPRVNAERLSDAAKIEKWFTRNCNWTLGRACSPQEKGDFLLFISGQ